MTETITAAQYREMMAGKAARQNDAFKGITPAEEGEQAALFEWARLESHHRTELELLYHIPNGDLRHPAVAKRLKAQGVKAGVPDICLPVPRKMPAPSKAVFHGLYIELKAPRRGARATEAQEEWIEALSAQGYRAVVCHGFEAAKVEIENYLALEG